MKRRKVNLSQEELFTIISLLELNEDNDDFREAEQKEFSNIKNKLIKHCDLFDKIECN